MGQPRNTDFILVNTLNMKLAIGYTINQDKTIGKELKLVPYDGSRDNLMLFTLKKYSEDEFYIAFKADETKTMGFSHCTS